MKHFLFCFGLYIGSLGACPTCIGTHSPHSTAPFFSDEHYQQPEHTTEAAQSTSEAQDAEASS